MCGIIGHIACKASQRSRGVVLGGLTHLEYRGYDSAGVALTPPDRLDVRRALGKLINLSEDLDTQPPTNVFVGIGHTRWVTHDRPTVTNAHPHSSPDGRFSLIRNSIIGNADALRAVLIADGEAFVSEADTEVVVHLLARAHDRVDPASFQRAITGLTRTNEEVTHRLVVALRAVTGQLHGILTLLVLSTQSPNIIVAARRSPPLVVGLGKGENFLGSDILVFIEHTNHAVEIDQDEVVVISVINVTVIDPTGNPVEREACGVDFPLDHATKSGWPTFMEKEIHEQPGAVDATLAGRIDSHGHLTLGKVRIPQHVLRSVNKIIIIGCGTASYTGRVAHYAIEHWCRIPVEVELSSEFRYRDPVIDGKTLIVAISQSGETMDMIQAIRHAREQGAKVVAIVNTPGSTISRESDVVTLTHAGPEIAAASTKAFTAQVAACYILGLYLAQAHGNKYTDEITGYMDRLGAIPDAILRILDSGGSVRQFARTMQDAASVIYLGRHVGFPVALEGALKLKEICYIHAEGFATDELRHGPITLMDEGQPVIVIVSAPRRPELYGKVLASIAEVRTRGAHTIIIIEKGDSSVDEFAEVVFRIPAVPTLYAPLLTIVPPQTFVCKLAAVKGLDVNQPRNLAKSVTVE